MQLTWDYNYKLFGTLLNLDLMNKPDLVLDPDVASKVIVTGMKDGKFTGRKLSRYINSTSTDYIHARSIINGNDQAYKIASYAMQAQSNC